VAKETNELIVVFSESDRKVRFDIPKSEITFTGSSVLINNTADIQKYKVYRDTPLPQDNKSVKPTATAQEDDVHQILSDESSGNNTREKESPTASAKLLLRQTSVPKGGKEESTAKVPVKTTTKTETKTATTRTTAAIPRFTINKVQPEKIQQPRPITATTTAELPKQPSNATTILQQDQSSLTNKKEEEKEKEDIATSKKEEAIRSKVLDVPSEPATNETSGLMDKPPITKEESKISPASSSTPSTIPLSETTPTNVSSKEEPSEKIVVEKAVETAAEKSVTKEEAEIAASSPATSNDVSTQQKEQTVSDLKREKENVLPEVEVSLKPPHNLEFNPPLHATEIPKAIEEARMSNASVVKDIEELKKRQYACHETKKVVLDNNEYLSNDILSFNTTIMALWQYSIIDGIDIYNEFATNAAKIAEYWLDVFWNPAARRKERKEKVVVGR
jgi:hypothetical protein